MSIEPPPPVPPSSSPPPLPPVSGSEAAEQTRPVSRPLLLGWCIWLLVSWLVNLTLDGPAAMPTVRWMLMSTLVGLLIAWPVWRLSLPAPRAPTLATVVDLFFLLLIFQVVVLRVALEWPLDHTLLIDGAVTVYALAAGLCVDIGRRGGPVRRSVAMLVCLALVAVPGVAFGGAATPAAVAMSPVRAVWLLAEPTTMIDAHATGLRLAVTGAAVIALWALLRAGSIAWARRFAIAASAT